MRATLATNLLIQGITFLTSIITARILGPEGRGELAIIFLYPQLVASVSIFGIDRSVAILAGRGDIKNPAIVVLILCAILTPIAVLVSFLTIINFIKDPKLKLLSIEYIIYIPALYIYLLSTLIFNGIGDFKKFNLVRIGFYITNALILTGMVIYGVNKNLDLFVYANLISVYLGMFIAIYLIFKIKVNAYSNVSRIKLTPIFYLALPFAFPAALSHFGSFAYQIILEQHSTKNELGLFIILFSYSRLIAPIGNAVGAHIFHIGISNNCSDLAAIFRRSFITYLFCSILLLIPAKLIVPLIFGTSFIVDFKVLIILAFTCIFSLSADSMAEYLKGHAIVKREIISLSAALGLIFILGWILVPKYGLLGMAIALSISEVVRCYLVTIRAAEISNTYLKQYWKINNSDIAYIINKFSFIKFK